MNGPIERFAGNYKFLSNFYITPVFFEGNIYASVEHAFQAAKTEDPDLRYRIRRMPEPRDAKKFGRTLKIRSGWDGLKIRIMRDLLRSKFEDSYLRDKLLWTAPAKLVEGNWWHDNYWGNCTCGKRMECFGFGHNHLGRLLMHLRDSL